MQPVSFQTALEAREARSQSWAEQQVAKHARDAVAQKMVAVQDRIIDKVKEMVDAKIDAFVDALTDNSVKSPDGRDLSKMRTTIRRNARPGAWPDFAS